MENHTFFVSWELWEEMTFVLAMSIVVVFFLGVGKLYWINHHIRKHEVLDAEKQVRLSQIRKSGLINGKRVGEIPFGIRALESGVEIHGIWISRPMSNMERKASATPVVVGRDGDEKQTNKKNRKGKEKAIGEGYMEDVRRKKGKGPYESPVAEVDDSQNRDTIAGPASPPVISGDDGTQVKTPSRKSRLSLLDTENSMSETWTLKEVVPIGEVDYEQAKKLRSRDKKAFSSRREVKHMTSMEGREEQEKKWRLGGGIGVPKPSSFEGASGDDGPLPSTSTMDSFRRPDSGELSGSPTPLPSSQSKDQASFYQRIRSILSEETLQQLEGQTSKPRRQLETYIPKSQFRDHLQALGDPRRQDSQNSSTSATESFMTSGNNASSNTSGSRSAAVSQATSGSGIFQRGHHFPHSQRSSQSQSDRPSSSERGPFGSSFDTPPNATPLFVPVADRSHPVHHRHTGRDMGPGFEPAGTFGIASAGAFALAPRDQSLTIESKESGR